MNTDKIKSLIKEHPVPAIVSALAVGGLTGYVLFSTPQFVGCLTDTTSLGGQRCLKYSYPPLNLIEKVSDTKCPPPPPQYRCP